MPGEHHGLPGEGRDYGPPPTAVLLPLSLLRALRAAGRDVWSSSRYGTRVVNARFTTGSSAGMRRTTSETVDIVRLLREVVVPRHQGQLLYEGNRRGAVFTVVLPPFGA
jgi:hypothetical protein